MTGERMERALALARKELLGLRRDPKLLRLVFVAPVLQLMIFGYAVSTDVRDTRLFVVDHDRTASSRALVESMTSSGYFRVVGRSDRPRDLVAALDRGRAVVGLQIPPGYSAAIHAPGGAVVQVLVDGSNSNIATVALGYAEQIVRTHGLASVSAAYRPPIDLRERAWYNPALLSRIFNVPAVIGSIMLLVSLLLTALAVVREREIGTLEQLMVSPLTPGELILGKTLPFAAIALFDMALITTIALLWFHVPFTGNFLLLLAAALLFLLSSLGLGLLISTISSTQQEAFLASFMLFMPLMLLSGFMFPVSSMPAVFQWLTLLNPLRHYLEIVRAVFLKAAGLDALWFQFTALFVMGTTVMVVAASRFRKTVA
jgi:ABC-2 type transport system permease protein